MRLPSFTEVLVGLTTLGLAAAAHASEPQTKSKQPPEPSERMMPITGTGQARVDSMRREALKMPPNPLTSESTRHTRIARPIEQKLTSKERWSEVKVLGFVDGYVIIETMTPPATVMQLPAAERAVELRRYQRRVRLAGNVRSFLANRIGERVAVDVRMDPLGFSYLVDAKRARPSGTSTSK